MYVCFSSVIELMKCMGICCCIPICLGERFINITSIKTIYLTMYFFTKTSFKMPKQRKKKKLERRKIRHQKHEKKSESRKTRTNTSETLHHNEKTINNNNNKMTKRKTSPNQGSNNM